MADGSELMEHRLASGVAVLDAALASPASS